MNTSKKPKHCAIEVGSNRRGFFGTVVGASLQPKIVTPTVDDYIEARDMAREWAEERGYSIVASDEI